MAPADRQGADVGVQVNHKHYQASAMANQPGPDGQLAPRLQNLGTHAIPVSTRNERAQLFINQGINLTYGFNHAEAGRAFAEAARLLEEPAPPSTNAFLKGSWHYVRGLAFVATRQLPQAEQELETLRGIMKDPSLDSPLFSKNTARTVLKVAPEVLASRGKAEGRGQAFRAGHPKDIRKPLCRLLQRAA